MTNPQDEGPGWEDVHVAGRYPKEFKEGVIRVARDRGTGETLEQSARDFGIHPITV